MECKVAIERLIQLKVQMDEFYKLVLIDFLL